jgi:hypothetical protein
MFGRLPGNDPPLFILTSSDPDPSLSGVMSSNEQLYHFMIILAAITTAVGIQVVDPSRMPSDTISIHLDSLEGYCVPVGVNGNFALSHDGATLFHALSRL